MDRPDVPFEAVNQAGTFTRSQAYADGWTPRQVRRRLQAARWKRVAGIALTAADTEVGPWQLAFAVVLSWPEAVISHELAAALHGFPVDTKGVGTATVPLHRSLKARGLRSHRLPIRPAEIGRVGGLPVTGERRTALDLLRHLPWDQARDLWAWLSTRRRLTLDDLAAEATRAGVHGNRQLRRLVRASASGALSAGEDRLHDLLRTERIGGWEANARIVLVPGRVAVADVLFRRHRLVIEVDGYASHGGRTAFQRDRTRQNDLVGAGYVVLRFTWADLVDRPALVARTIRAALARSGTSYVPE